MTGTPSFSGFAQTDFDAYLERKWGSNAFTLERMRVKDKFSALAQHLAPLFAALSDDVTMHLSDEHPNIVNHKKVDAQWLYYCRSQAQAAELARFLEKTELKPDRIFNLAPQDKHASLALVLDTTGVRAGFFVHAGAWVDRKNLAAKLANQWDKEKLKNLLSAQDTAVTVELGDDAIAAHDIELSAFDSLGELLRGDDRRFAVWRRLTTEEAQSQAGAFAETLRATFEALLPLYQFATWSKANDHIAVGEQIKTAKQEQRRNPTELKLGDKVKVQGGLFAGKTGVVQAIDAKHVKVAVGTMSVNVATTDVAKA